MTVMTSTSAYRPHLWMAGDLNAFFGFGTNILVNMLVLTGLLRFVVKMPDAIVFGRILPALGLMLCRLLKNAASAIILHAPVGKYGPGSANRFRRACRRAATPRFRSPRRPAMAR